MPEPDKGRGVAWSGLVEDLWPSPSVMLMDREVVCPCHAMPCYATCALQSKRRLVPSFFPCHAPVLMSTRADAGMLGFLPRTLPHLLPPAEIHVRKRSGEPSRPRSPITSSNPPPSDHIFPPDFSFIALYGVAVTKLKNGLQAVRRVVPQRSIATSGS